LAQLLEYVGFRPELGRDHKPHLDSFGHDAAASKEVPRSLRPQAPTGQERMEPVDAGSQAAARSRRLAGCRRPDTVRLRPAAHPRSTTCRSFVESLRRVPAVRGWLAGVHDRRCH
jgi:hypothetical protein